MSQTLPDPRLRYLENASWLLLATSPAASAHIQSIRNTGIENGIAESGMQYKPCTACGSILIPGWSCKKQSTRPQRRKSFDNERGRNELKFLRLQCTKCNSITRFDLPKLSKNACKKPSVAQSQLAPPKPDTATEIPTVARHDAPAMPSPTTDSGAKRRGRNKKSSLQSLLANKPTGNGPAPAAGLNLMDFIKK